MKFVERFYITNLELGTYGNLLAFAKGSSHSFQDLWTTPCSPDWTSPNWSICSSFVGWCFPPKRTIIFLYLIEKVVKFDLKMNKNGHYLTKSKLQANMISLMYLLSRYLSKRKTIIVYSLPKCKFFYHLPADKLPMDR